MTEIKCTPGPWTNDDGLVNGKESRDRFSNPSIDIFDANEWPEELADEAQANARLIAAAPDQNEALERLLFDLENLIDHSRGVAGLHLNGDVAPWSDLTEGGRFEEWLAPAIAQARAALAKAGAQ